MKIAYKPILKSYRWPLFALLFVSFFSAILGDSTAEALLLAQLGSSVVPGLFLVNALLLFMVSVFIMSVIDRIDRGSLFVGFVFVHALILLVIRAAVAMKAGFLFAPLFSYAYVTKIMLFLLFWTLANDLVDSRRARAEFPFIAAGGTLGAISVSFAIPYLLRMIPAENLLLIWSISGLITGVLFLPIRQSYRNYFRPVADRTIRLGKRLGVLWQDLALVRTEPLLRSMGLFYFLLFFVIFNQHFAFYSALKAHFSHTENQARELAAFLGYFNGISMFSTFLLQVTVAGVVIRKAGSTRALFILPSVLLVVFGILSWLGLQQAMGSHPYPHSVMFWAIVAGLGVRIAFFDSFFSPNFQVFFSSLPQAVRGRGKLSIEGVVKPLAMVAAGIWLGAVVPRIPFYAHMLTIVAVTGFMVYQTSRFRGTYAESLARYLRGFRSRNTEWLRTLSVLPKETLFLDLSKDILEREDSSLKEYIIELLASAQSPETQAILMEHLHGGDARTRATIISALTGSADPEFRKIILDRALNDTDERVVANCVQALAAFDDEETAGVLRAFLGHANSRIRANAVVGLWKKLPEGERTGLREVLDAMLATTSAQTCASALYALGEIQHPDLIPLLGRMYVERADQVLADRMVWRQYTKTLARCPDPRALDLLLAIADRAGSRQRNDLSTALGLLIGRGFDAERLLFRLTEVSFIQRGVILRAVYGRRLALQKEARRALHEVANREVQSVYGDWVAVDSLSAPPAGSAPREVLRYALIEECIGERMRNLLYLSSMLDTSGQIKSIIHRLQHENRYVRARAYEILDNMGDLRINRAILKLLESSDPVLHAREAMATYGFAELDLGAVVHAYAHSPSAWIRECVASMPFPPIPMEAGAAA